MQKNVSEMRSRVFSQHKSTGRRWSLVRRREAAMCLPMGGWRVATCQGPWLLTPEASAWRMVLGGPEGCETDVQRKGLFPTLNNI